MLSKTAETKPRPKAVEGPAGGSALTGIIEAQSTRDRRKLAPFTAPGISPHARLRMKAATRIAAQTQRIVTLRRKTERAMTLPIMAAAMLWRNEERTNT